MNPVVTRRETDEAEVEQPAGFSVARFLSEVREELSRVSWMSPRELAISTGVTCAAVVVTVTMLWAYDAVLSRLLRLFLR